MLSSKTNALLTHTLASFWRKQSCLLCIAFTRLFVYLNWVNLPCRSIWPHCPYMVQCNTVYSSLGKKRHLLPYLVVPLISARVPLLSTRVSAHCQAILLNKGKLTIKWAVAMVLITLLKFYHFAYKIFMANILLKHFLCIQLNVILKHWQ